ncbi:phage tail tape measure protein [Macellibacteroides sp. HH-ZS]|nr:phage tail tape measure protein [Macellibacteroides sp. HH-ZS]
MANDKIVTRRGIYLYINGQEVSNDVKSIRAEMSKLVNQQAKMTMGSEEYIRAGQKIKALNGILAEHRNQWMKTNSEIDKSKDNMFSLSKVADGFNKYFGMVTAAIASLTGISFAMRKSVDDYAEMEEAMANVRKYTGMTTEEVKDLNEEFKKMDTRTPRLELNGLAAEAGKLGITGKQNLIDFVEAANTIKVALGEDLGEDAILNIGKLANMFGEVERSGIKNAMLAVGSAVNQVGQSSMASEKYLVEFTARMAGTANQAGMSISEILGYASVLDQNMIQQEMAATALQTVMLGMYQKPAQFAKLAGMELKAFTKLVEEDANEAFLTLLQTMSSKGGLQQLAPIFKDLGVEGSRAISVLNSIVSNVGKLRSEQENAAQAYKEANSVTNEYNVQNTTAKAVIEKNINKFNEFSIMLGEKLAPHMGLVTTSGSMLLKILSALTDIIIDHGATMVRITAVIIAYNVGLKAMIAYHTVANGIAKASLAVGVLRAASIAKQAGNIERYNKAMRIYNGLAISNSVVSRVATAATLLWAAAKALFTGNLVRATAAMKLFIKATSVSPLGIALAVITAIGVALYALHKKATVAASAMEIVYNVNKKANEAIADEKTQLNLLLAVARDETISKKKREEAIKAINEISPEYLSNLTLDKINTTEATTAIENYTKALMNNARMKAAKDEIERIEKEKLPLEREKSELNDFFSKAPKGSESYRIYEEKIGAITAKINKLNIEAERYIKVYTDAAKVVIPTSAEYEARRKAEEEAARKAAEEAAKNTAGAASEEEKKKAYEKALNNLEEAYKKENNVIKQEYISRKKTQDEMQDSLLQSEMNYLYAKKILQEKFGKSSVETEGQLADKIIDAAKKRQKEQEELDKVLKAKKEEDPEENPIWEKLAKGTEIQLAANESLYNAGLISHQEYLRKKTELEDKAREEKEKKDEEAAEKEMALKETILGAISSLSNSAVSFIKSGQAKEEKAIEEKYKYKLILAEADNEATAELEEQKEAELLSIRKKYADKAFAFQVLSITAETAVAAMRAYSAALELGLPGIPLAPIMAGVAIAAGAAQIAVANQQREQAAQMWDGGYTGEGGKYEPKKLIQTHGGEFVANKNTVRLLRPMFDVIDYAQKTGNVAALTGPEMTAAVSGNVYRSPALYQATAAQASEDASYTPDVIRALAENTRVMAKLNARLNDKIEAEVAITGDKGLKKQQDSYDQLIKNATR